MIRSLNFLGQNGEAWGGQRTLFFFPVALRREGVEGEWEGREEGKGKERMYREEKEGKKERRKAKERESRAVEYRHEEDERRTSKAKGEGAVASQSRAGLFATDRRGMSCVEDESVL